ncbi:MAG: hypothetical protein JST73_01025 [Actinobacteria bacterium]|nr:hypothetical protein [Actinomycetota bacterium]
MTDDPAKMIDDYDDIDDADDIDADTPEGARLHKEARSRKGGVFVDTNGDDAWLHEEILEAADGRRQKKLRIRPTPMNEDWLRTMSWNFPRNITAEQFERLFASRTLEEFMRLPAARPMPAKLRADVMRRIEQRAEQPPPDKTDGPSDPRELVS